MRSPRPRPRPRPGTALIAALAGICLLAATWLAAVHVGLAARVDESILRGFAGLQRRRVDHVANLIARLCDPKPYLLLAAVPVIAALLRRRPRVAVTVGGVMLGANVTTQLLKSLLSEPSHYGLPGPFIGPHSWPSGHATAVMSLALCAVMAAPARRRPLVAAVMAAFAVAVCYSFLELGWHYPSDVLGGFEVASVWALLGVAALGRLEERHPSRRPVPGSARGPQVSIAEALAPVALLVLAGLVCAAIVALARPVAVVDYANDHKLFVLGALAIAGLGLAIATAATLILRRG